MSISLDRKKEIILKLYTFISLFIFSIVTLNGNTFFADIVVSYIQANKVFVHLGVTVLFIIITLPIMIKDKVKIDGILISLFIFNLTVIMHIFDTNYDVTQFWGNYLNIIISLITYFIFMQYSGNYNKIINIFTLFGVLLSIQVLLTALINQVPISNIYYKTYMRIPFAASNIISSAILPIIFLTKLSLGKSLKRDVFIGIMVVGVIFTKSRTGLILLILFWIICMYKNIDKNKYKNSKYMLLTIFVIIFLMIFLTREKTVEILIGYANKSNLSIDSLSSGRLSIFIKEIQRGLGNFIFGTGIGYEKGALSGAHNILIDLFVQTGISGVTNYIVAITILFRLRRHIKYDYQKGLLIFLYILFINSMVEVCYLNYINDVLFWSIAGLLRSSINLTESKRYNNNEMENYNDEKGLSFVYSYANKK